MYESGSSLLLSRADVTLLSVPLELTTLTLLLTLVVTALVQAPTLCGDCLYGFQGDEDACIKSDVTGEEVMNVFIPPTLFTPTSSDLLTTEAKFSSKTSWLSSLNSGELFFSLLAFSVLFDTTGLMGGACTAMLLACSMVGHSDEDDGIAAKFPRTGAGEVLVSVLSEDDNAFDMVAVEVVGVI